VEREFAARRLFNWLPVLLGLGILAFFEADGLPSPWPALACAMAAATAAWALRDHLVPMVVLLSLATMGAGFAAAAWRAQTVAAPVLERMTIGRVSGTVEVVERRLEGGRLVLRLTEVVGLSAGQMPRRARVTVASTAGLQAGQHITAMARLLPPPQPARPHGYDFAREAYFQEIGAVGRLLGAPQLAPGSIEPPWPARLMAAVDNARNALTDRIHATLGGSAGGLAAALVTGKRGYLSETDNAQLRAAGLYHIVSISGLHMVLAAGVFFWMARALLAAVPRLAQRWPVKKLAAAIAMLGATAYCIFSGGDVATQRALVMTLVMLGAILVDRPALTLRNLAIAALLVMLRQPETLLGPSFQMSFAAVAGLIAAAEEWRRYRQRAAERDPVPDLAARGWQRWPGRALLWIGASLATTVIATFATAPFSAYHFNQGAPLGLIGNALAIPFVSVVVMPSAVAGVLLLPFGLDQPVWLLMGEGCRLVMLVAAWVASLPGAEQAVPSFPPVGLAFFAAGFLWLTLWTTTWRFAGIAFMIGAGFVAIHQQPSDIFVDRAGALAAVRGEDGRLALLARRPAAFVLDQWYAADGDRRKVARTSDFGVSRCDPWGCVARLPDQRAVALVLDPRAFAEDCSRAAIVITPLSAPGFCRATTEVFDRGRLAETGAVRLTATAGGWRIDRSRPALAVKPWFGRPAPAPVSLPAAAAPASTRAVATGGPAEQPGQDVEQQDEHGAEPLQ
jgi:competence protein ComEC